MPQIKIFVGREDHTAELESDVNTWISESGVEVLSITGNIASQSVLPGKDSGPSNIGGAGALGRRFAPSDILVLIQYEK
ncbi:MAG: hypothetical protein AAGH88_01150 [Planctomycetota bacterium]